MEIEGDSFLDYNAPTQPINRINSQSGKKQINPSTSNLQEPEPVTLPFKKLTDKNYKGDLEIRMTI